MRTYFLRFDFYIQKAVAVFASSLMALAACLGLLQVLSRFLFRFPFEWTEVLIRISLAWMVFVGVALVFRMGAMISVDMMARLMPQRFRRAHEAFILVAILSFLALLGWWGIDYARRGSVQTIIGLDQVSIFWAYLAIPVGCVCAAIGAIAHFIDPRHETDKAELEHSI